MISDFKIILVRGLPGSGKTWLCERVSTIPGAVCFDTDDFVTRAYEHTPNEPAEVREMAVELLDKAIAESTARVRVVVGVTLYSKQYRVGDGDVISLYVKLNPKEFYEVYSRTLTRQLNVWKNMSVPEGLAGEELAWWMYAHHIQAVSVDISCSDYVARYNNARDFDRKNGYRPASQTTIIELVRRLATKKETD
jgi:shikimate kinase